MLFCCVPSLHPIKVCAGERCENESLSLRGGLVLVAKIYDHAPRYLLLSVLCTAQIRPTLYSASLFPPLPFCTALYNGCDGGGAIHPFIQSVCGVIVTALLLFGLSFSLILSLSFFVFHLTALFIRSLILSIDTMEQLTLLPARKKCVLATIK